jgi:hypothetical protein
LAEIIANHEYEMQAIPQTSYIGGWANCFKGGLSNGSSNLRRTLLGIIMQMMQQVIYIYSYRPPKGVNGYCTTNPTFS